MYLNIKLGQSEEYYRRKLLMEKIKGNYLGIYDYLYIFHRDMCWDILLKNDEISPTLAYSYCENKIKGRDTFLEQYILKNKIITFQYIVYVIKERWPEAEEIIIKEEWMIMPYIEGIIKGPWPEAEPIIACSDKDSFTYADSILNDRFPAGEFTIMSSPWYKRKYITFLKHINKYEEYLVDSRQQWELSQNGKN